MASSYSPSDQSILSSLLLSPWTQQPFGTPVLLNSSFTATDVLLDYTQAVEFVYGSSLLVILR